MLCEFLLRALGCFGEYDPVGKLLWMKQSERGDKLIGYVPQEICRRLCSVLWVTSQKDLEHQSYEINGLTALPPSGRCGEKTCPAKKVILICHKVNPDINWLTVKLPVCVQSCYSSIVCVRETTQK